MGSHDPNFITENNVMGLTHVPFGESDGFQIFQGRYGNNNGTLKPNELDESYLRI